MFVFDENPKTIRVVSQSGFKIPKEACSDDVEFVYVSE